MIVYNVCVSLHVCVCVLEIEHFVYNASDSLRVHVCTVTLTVTLYIFMNALVWAVCSACSKTVRPVALNVLRALMLSAVCNAFTWVQYWWPFSVVCSASEGLCAYIFMRSGTVGRTKLNELIDVYHRGGNDTESASKFLPIETMSCVCLLSRRLDGIIWRKKLVRWSL